MKTNTPLLSVVIPTHNRPQYLPRAVKSALGAAPNGDVEVIVVPNGGDETWRESLADLLDDQRIIVSPVEKGHANVARNHGMSLATGKYIRFLDDDDYLYSQNCQQQLLEVIATNSNLAIANLDVGTESDNLFNVMQINKEYDDFHSLILNVNRVTHVCSYVFQKKFLAGIFWDEECNLGQDTKFIFDIISKKKYISFLINNFSTGIWIQHPLERISTSHKLDAHLRVTYSFIETAVISLGKDISKCERKKLAIESLWVCAHIGFPYAPLYWSKKILKILSLDIHSRPLCNIYLNFVFIHPLIIEWIFFPYRFLKMQIRNFFRIKKKNVFWE